MPRHRYLQTNFRGGEVSPEVYGRVDLELYQSSCEKIENFILRSEGGISFRPGTQFIANELVLYRMWNTSGLPTGQTLNSGNPVELSGKVRIFPFIFNRTESYAIIITQFSGDTGIAIINTDTLAASTVAYQGATTWWDATRFKGYASSDDFDEVQFAQTGDLIFFCHPDYPPYYIARTGAGTFEIREWWRSPAIISSNNNTSINPFGERGVPYQTVNLDTTLTLSAALTGGGFNQTVTASKAFFTPDMVGAVLKINSGGVTNYRFITSYTDSTNVVTQSGLSGAKPAIAATANFEVSEWYEGRGWPRTLTFFEQRLYFAGTEKAPDTTWGSQIADIFEFDSLGAVTDVGYGTPTASKPFGFAVASNEVNQIQWISAARVLNIGTLGREYTASGSQGALSQLDILVSPETAYGSTFRQALRSANTLLFIGRSANKIREFVFNRDENSYIADDLTNLADHMPFRTLELVDDTSAAAPEINHMAKTETYETIIWVIDNNGGLYCTTRDKQAQINAWSYQKIGGSFGGYIPFVHSLASIPSGDGTNDDLWIAVEREIDGNNVTYIERMNKEFSLNSVFNSSTSILDKMVYCDSAILYRPGGTFTVVPGLDHLEGEEVTVVADGACYGTFTVSGGQITMNESHTEAIVGLPYEGTLKTLNLEAGSALGNSQGALKKYDQMLVRLSRTIGLQYGFEDGRLDDIEFRPVDLPMDQPIPLFNGDKNVIFPLNFDREGRVVLKQILPLPCRVNAISIRGLTND